MSVRDIGAELERFEGQMLRLHGDLGHRALACGVAEWDRQVWQAGREWLNEHAAGAAPAANATARAADVYLATQIYDVGGHTTLIGDFVRALNPGGAQSFLLVTNLHGQNSDGITDELEARLALPRGHVTILEAASRGERFEQAFARLQALQPNRLFLFHHAHDPLASAVTHPEIAAHAFLVHHADRLPSFGWHVPGVRIVSLSPSSAATTSVLGQSPALLPLTAPDPGPRPHGFLRRGRVTTASSGSAHKFATPYVFAYAQAVAVMLRATGGWHVHIGPLSEMQREEIDGALERHAIPRDCFIHVPWTASVARTLWDEQCDVYCASFPIDGARTRVEVLASATPYVFHSRRPQPEVRTVEGPRIGLPWRTLEELTARLWELSAHQTLQSHSALMRAEYERTHRPDVFAAVLENIVGGGEGQSDPERHEHRERSRAALVQLLDADVLRDETQQELLAGLRRVVADA